MPRVSEPEVGGSDNRRLYALRYPRIQGGVSRARFGLLQCFAGLRGSVRATRARDDARARSPTPAVVQGPTRRSRVGLFAAAVRLTTADGPDGVDARLRCDWAASRRVARTVRHDGLGGAS